MVHIGDTQHVHRVVGGIAVPAVPSQVIGGQLRIIKVSPGSAFDIGSGEADAAPRTECIETIAEHGSGGIQRKVLYDVVTIDPVNASGGDWPRLGQVEVHVRPPYDIGIDPSVQPGI